MEWIKFAEQEPPLNKQVFIRAGAIMCIGGIFDDWKIHTEKNGILTMNGIPWSKFKITKADVFWLKEE